MKGLPPIRREDVAVSVPLVALYPSLGDGRVDTPLKVAVPHLKELMPPENARDRDFVLGEHCKNLTCSEVSINFWNCHRYPPLLHVIINARMPPASIRLLYPRCYREFCWTDRNSPTHISLQRSKSCFALPRALRSLYAALTSLWNSGLQRRVATSNCRRSQYQIRTRSAVLQRNHESKSISRFSAAWSLRQ